MIVAKVVQNTDTATLDSFVRQAVDKDKVDFVATDEQLGYRMLSRGDAHRQDFILMGSG
jgi:hypothetical protein